MLLESINTVAIEQYFRYKISDLFNLYSKNGKFSEYLGYVRYNCYTLGIYTVFVCVEVLRPSQPNGVMSSAVSLPNHTFTGQA